MKNPQFLRTLSFSWAIFFFFLLLTKPSFQQFYPPNAPLIPNPRLQNAYIALQAWKHAITSDPNDFTANWYGPEVCNYTGVYCAPAPNDPHNTTTVAGIDLNHANIAGYLPEDLGLLADLALFHINSNRFHGTLPSSFCKLHLLFELDVSNNKFTGEFPSVVFSLPSLKFLDIRYNEFHGKIPSELFDLKLDALFINNNYFQSSLPENLGNSPVSVLVLANNAIRGCIPSSFSKMAGTLSQIILLNSGLTGCLNNDLGNFKNVKVFDVSSNNLVGPLPESIGEMKLLEQLNVAHNNLSGDIPESICTLPRLKNFTYSYNYFCSEPPICLKVLEYRCCRLPSESKCLPKASAMAVGKNKRISKGKKGGKKKATDPFAKKDWYDIKAPSVFTTRNVGKTLVTRTQGTKIASEGLKHRVFEISLADLQGGDEDHAYRKIRLRAEDVQGKNVLTNFWGMDFTTDKVRSLVRKWQTLIEAHVDVKTTDNYTLRMFCIGFTKRRPNQVKRTCYAQSSQIRQIRRKMVEIMTAQATSCDLKDLVQKFIPEMIGKEIEKATSSIYPLQNVFIRKVKILKAPKFDLGKLMEVHGDYSEDIGVKLERPVDETMAEPTEVVGA
ncbi:hypothetical protein SLEP1_g29877 [Rubroshorea leprosula]|uniref:Small ribosomal subunit protein eS1 n=1 Tax=Rubroshorea leprosula TaxID=152421 RepID=A0AAV5K0T7_9ROSI|nr:hypothetical protein SLEP1_g29877 [Rubroshorea leprosula]